MTMIITSPNATPITIKTTHPNYNKLKVWVTLQAHNNHNTIFYELYPLQYDQFKIILKEMNGTHSTNELV
jgi:hypothetical protein